VISHGPKFREAQHINWKREERQLRASWSLNTDLGRLLTQFLSL
jgi:hypothetical protein